MFLDQRCDVCGLEGARPWVIVEHGGPVPRRELGVLWLEERCRDAIATGWVELKEQVLA